MIQKKNTEYTEFFKNHFENTLFLQCFQLTIYTHDAWNIMEVDNLSSLAFDTQQLFFD